MLPLFILYTSSLLWLSVWLLFGSGLLVPAPLTALTLYEFGDTYGLLMRMLSYVFVFFFGLSTSIGVVGFMYTSLNAIKNYMKIFSIITIISPFIFLLLIAVNWDYPISLDYIEADVRHQKEIENQCCYSTTVYNTTTKSYEYIFKTDCLTLNTIDKQLTDCYLKNDKYVCNESIINEITLHETKSNVLPILMMVFGMCGTFITSIIMMISAYFEIHEREKHSSQLLWTPRIKESRVVNEFWINHK
ncbi:hypothetical protein QTN25_004418 [Entamoeba marina]